MEDPTEVIASAHNLSDKSIQLSLRPSEVRASDVSGSPTPRENKFYKAYNRESFFAD